MVPQPPPLIEVLSGMPDVAVIAENASRWQPVSALPMIASMIDGMLRDTEEQYHLLQRAKDRFMRSMMH